MYLHHKRFALWLRFDSFDSYIVSSPYSFVYYSKGAFANNLWSEEFFYFFLVLLSTTKEIRKH